MLGRFDLKKKKNDVKQNGWNTHQMGFSPILSIADRMEHPLDGTQSEFGSNGWNTHTMGFSPVKGNVGSVPQDGAPR